MKAKSNPDSVHRSCLGPSAPEDGMDTGPEGLSSAQARVRLKRYGPNTFRDTEAHSLTVEFLKRFGNPLIVILIAASLIAGLTGQLASFVIIVVMVVASVTLDFTQEYRAHRASERLRKSVQLHAAVVRGGVVHRIRVSGVVPGDLVLLAAGSLIPADGMLVEGRDLFVNQSILTGESFPVEKRARNLAASDGENMRDSNALFMGSSLISGTGRMLVCRTGSSTALGKIAHSLDVTPPPTAFEIGTRRFGMLIMRLTLMMVLFVLLVNTALHRPLFESFLFALALAVGLTPELLPMVVSVTLSRGALSLAGKGVVVKRLAAVQNLGAMDVLCTDKTGTLTEARIHLEGHVNFAGMQSPKVFELAYLNSHFETGIKSPLDAAILERPAPPIGAWRKVDEVPFDFERRRVSVLLDEGDVRVLIVKGAPEELLRLCSHYRADESGGVRTCDGEVRVLARRQLAALENQGQRVLGVAYRELPKSHEHAAVGDEAELVFGGFAVFLDPPKPSAVAALSALAASGVQVKILTGDSELVTEHLCATLGIAVVGTLTGAEIERINDDGLAARAEQANLFCRVSPAQKNRIILALKSRRHVVGYLGDGINDAPALHSADVGLSVEGAADVAREAADMILTRHDLRVLHDGVLEGRRTFANVRKYIMMGTSSNFGNMFSMAAASVFLPFLPMLPVQILLNNILYDISEVPIPLDRVDEDSICRPQVWDMRFIRNFMLVIGLVSSLFDFLTFYVLFALMHAGEALFHTGWFIESLVSQVLVIFVIRTRGSPFASAPSRTLTATSLAVVMLAFAFPFLPWARDFGFETPAPWFCVVLAVLVVVYLLVVEMVKRLFYRRMNAARDPAAAVRA
ncbi:MAG: magnesium-translocating P-type ATPase [Betaproteobacteria bacterium]|nr:magnesium-translocating P-type ATPase [Betaproteobacteria bacterium]